MGLPGGSWYGRLTAIAVVCACVALLAAVPGVGEAEARPNTRAKLRAEGKKEGFRWCRLQKAKSFLKRESFVKNGQLQGRSHQRAVKYRVERYGHIDGLGFEKLNAKSAFSHAAPARFMGLPLTVHEKIIPALACVERRIQKTCKKKSQSYTARAVGGFRGANSYRGGEVSNHLFGTAIDIDPEKNPCCGCVDPWPNNPRCSQGKSVWEKTSLPRCWVDAFERYGFYWLGRDQLEDTMHFEFLGDPDRILP
jgi:hypothetical protein